MPGFVAFTTSLSKSLSSIRLAGIFSFESSLGFTGFNISSTAAFEASTGLANTLFGVFEFLFKLFELLILRSWIYFILD